MKVTGYVVLEPGFDRPCISGSPPLTYQKKPGSKVYQFELDLPDWSIVDGKLEVKELRPLEDLDGPSRRKQAIKELEALEEEDRICGSNSPFGGHFRCDLENNHEGKHCHIVGRCAGREERMQKYEWD